VFTGWKSRRQAEITPVTDDEHPMAHLRHTIIGSIQDCKLNFILLITGDSSKESRGFDFLQPSLVLLPILLFPYCFKRELQLKANIFEVRTKAPACEISHIFQKDRVRPKLSNGPKYFGKEITVIQFAALKTSQRERLTRGPAREQRSLPDELLIFKRAHILLKHRPAMTCDGAPSPILTQRDAGIAVPFHERKVAETCQL
jgi:hypothetical protein